MLKLVIEDDEGNQQLISLEKDEFEISIGRIEGNNIRLKERNVSRRHALLSRGSDGIVYVDDFSRYGTKLNGQRLGEGEREAVTTADELQIGDYYMRLVDDSEDAQAQDQVDEGPQQLRPHEQPKLVVISSNFAGKEFKITRSEMIIGRTAEDSDIVIDDRSISRNHGTVRRVGRRDFELVDMGSSNGIKVNQRPISAYRLMSGDIIEMGQVRFRFCEPGENWYFNPEMLSATVAEPPPAAAAAGNRNVMIMAILAVIVVAGAVIAVVAMSGGDKPSEGGGGQSAGGPAPAESNLQGEIDATVQQIEKFRTAGEHDTAFGLALDLTRGEFFGNQNAQNAVKPLLNQFITHYQSKFTTTYPIPEGDKDPLEQAITAATKLEEIDSSASSTKARLKKEEDYRRKFVDANGDYNKGMGASANPDSQRLLCKGAKDTLGEIPADSLVQQLVLKQDLANKVDDCIAASYVSQITASIKGNKFSEAEAGIKGFKADVPGHAKIAALEKSLKDARARAEAANTRPDPPTRRDPKPDKPDPKPDKPKSKKSDCANGKSASELAKEAGAALRGNDPRKAAKLYSCSLKLKSDSGVRRKYALALEKASEFCKAAKQYKRAGKSAKADALSAEHGCK